MNKINIHAHFLAYCEAISITHKSFLNLNKKLIDVQDTIYNKLIKNKEIPEFKFDLLGSARTETMIETLNKISDIDFGIFFQVRPMQSCKELKDYLYKIIEEIEDCQIENRDKVLRLIFSDNLNIDISVYYLETEKNIQRLLRKNSWMKSDPQALYRWFLNINENRNQIIRLVKYYKCWAKLNKMKTPSGLALTVLVEKNYYYDESDEVAFSKTGVNLLIEMKKGVFCRNPIRPYDNLVSDLQKKHRRNFILMLENLVFQCDMAFQVFKEDEKINIWENVFGSQYSRALKELNGHTKF